MGAYKDGTIRLEQEMSARIRETLSKSWHQANDAKRLWSLGKGDDVRKLAEDIESALKRIELEGLGERIIRQIIHSLFQNGGRR